MTQPVSPATVDFASVYANLPNDGWLAENEARLIWHWLGQVAGDVLEVGCYQGRSTCLLAAFDPRRIVYSVDPFDDFCDHLDGDEVENYWWENVDARGLHNTVLFRQKVEDWEPRKVGLAYLDGDHTYQGTRAQVETALRCEAQVILVHDVNDQGEGTEIKRAAIELLGPWTDRVNERLAVWDRRGK